VVDILAAIRNAPPDAPMRCGSCSVPVRHDGFSLALASPHRVMAICTLCATSRDEIEQAAVRACNALA
jgi:hypothetical protein